MPGFMRWMAGSVFEDLAVLWLYEDDGGVRTGGGSVCVEAVAVAS